MHRVVSRSLFSAIFVFLPASGKAQTEDRPCAPHPIERGGSVRAAQVEDPAGLVVASINLAGQRSPEAILEEIRKDETLREADVLLLQEVVRASGPSGVLAADLAGALGMEYLFAAAGMRERGGSQGLATLSRYPLEKAEVLSLPRYDLRFRNRCRIALAAGIRTASGAVRLFNLHLDSRITIGERLEQLAPVLAAAGATGGACLIGGDFNTSRVRWLWRTVPLLGLSDHPAAVRRRLFESGFSTPFGSPGATFDYLGFQLDWIFLRGLQSLECGVRPIGFSDHHAIWLKASPE